MDKKSKKIFDLKNYKDGKFVVNACPGSGKTISVSERILKFIENWDSKQSGLLILSFTNVAIKEINDYYNEKSNNKICYPHYIGTFDKFINNFIFLPFGYLMMHCQKRPILVGSPYSTWFHSNYNFKYMDKISYDINGKIIYLEGIRAKLTNIKENKKKFNKMGYANQEDANYFTKEILINYPKITRSIVNRFPYLIVDEAQDLSEIQMKIIDILIDNGLKNVLLIGDPNQAIFEWKTAKPKLFIEKYNKWSKIKLNNTFRCGKKISEKLSILSNQEINPARINCQNDDFKLFSYKNNSDLSQINSKFNKIISDDEFHEERNYAILYRSKDQFLTKKDIGYSIKDILKDMKADEDYKTYKKRYKTFNFNKIKNYTVNIISAQCYLLNGDYFNYFKEFEKAYIKLKTNEFNNINENIKKFIKNNYFEYRIDVLNFIKNFDKPIENELVDVWINKINEKNIKVDNQKIFLNKIKVLYNNTNKFNERLTWKKILNKPQNNVDYHYGTIHSAKGKTFDSVLLILTSNCLKNLSNKNLNQDEELRDIYVGMSRAKNRLWIAVPEKDFKKCENFFSYKQVNLDLYLN